MYETVKQLLGNIGLLMIVASGLLLMVGARQIAGRAFLLGIFTAVVATVLGPGWLPY